jgi:uncharacterized protein (DUF1810 family)
VFFICRCPRFNNLTGCIDDLKLRSSMTLFANATEDNGVFLAVLDKFYEGVQDRATLAALNKDS